MKQIIDNLNELHCTTKAKIGIKSFTNDLSGRERQLLILMSSQAELCHRACERLLQKVDIISLINRGYLSSEEEMASDNTKHSDKTRQALSAANDSKPAVFNNPVLNVVAGIF